MKRNLIFMLICIIPAILQGQPYRYYKAQMHCHSTNSDGNMPPDQVVNEYKSRGYEIVFLTDHNVMSEIEHLSTPDMLCINSEEITFEKHMNGFFMNHTVSAGGITPQAAIDSVKAQGGLIQFNHPIVTLTGEDWSYTASQFLALENLDFIEIHNWGTEFTFAPFNKLVWDSVLSAGRRVWGTATDDMHKKTEVIIQTIDRGWVMLWLNNLCRDSVFNALKRGDFYASTGVVINSYSVKGDTFDISCTYCNKIQFIGDYGSIRKTVNGTSGQYVRTTDKYIRIYMEGNSGLLGATKIYAWTQPHFYDSPSVVRGEAANVATILVYPNPTEGKVNVQFSAAALSKIRISLYDEAGREVKNLMDGKIQQGFHNLTFDLSELKNGLYFIKVILDKTVSTQIIMKQS